MLKLKNIIKKYKELSVLNDVNFSVSKGEIIVVLGQSGTGKTTMLKCINRLVNIDSGVIEFNGVNILNIPKNELRQRIGFVFQELNLFDHLTALQNITIGLEVLKIESKEKVDQKGIELLKKIGLSEKINSYPDELSGGEKQRVAIARAIIMEPEIILFDEPTSALDRETAKDILNIIKELSSLETTFIIVTHESEMVLNIASRVIYLENGNVKYDDIVEKYRKEHGDLNVVCN